MRSESSVVAEHPMQSREDRRAITLVVSHHDVGVVEALLFALADRVRIVEDDPDAAVLMVMSQLALADPVWHEEVAARSGSRPIPLAIGPIKGAPEHLAELNWILFDPQDPVRTAAVVHAALGLDPEGQRLRRSLQSDAATWQLNRQSDQLLILDLKRTKRMASALDSAVGSSAASELELEYLRRSEKAARKARNRRIRGVAWRGLAIGLAAALIAGVIVEYRAASERQSFAVGSLDLGSWQSPAIRAIKALGPYVDSPERLASVPEPAMQSAELLGLQWPLATAALGWDAYISDAVALEDAIVTADTAGSLTWWNGDIPTDRVGVSEEPLVALASPTSAGEFAVASTSALIRIAPSGGVDSSAPAPLVASEVALSSDGRLAVLTDGTSVASMETGGQFTEPTAQGQRVLALIPTETEVLVLGVDDSAITIRDARSGSTIRSWAHDLAADLVPLTVGDYDPVSGVGFLAGGRSELVAFGNAPGVELSGLGAATSPDFLDVTPQGWVVVGSAESGVQLLFPEQRTSFGRICDLLDAPTFAAIPADGASITCGDGVQFVSYPLDALGPVAGDTALIEDSEAGGASAISVELDASGVGLAFGDGRTSRLERPVVAFDVSHLGTFAAITESGAVYLVEPGPEEAHHAYVGTFEFGSPVVEMAWLADGDLRFSTAAGTTWVRPSCTGCFDGERLIEEVAARISNCFHSGQLADMPANVVSRFALRECAPIPEIRGS